MINNKNEVQQKNIELLVEGYWYEELPPIIDIENMKPFIKRTIERIENGEYTEFERNDNGIIEKYRSVDSPSYVFNDGIEPITFFEFKKNGALREMQMPNLKYYCTFVYNTMAMYEKLFMKLYTDPSMKEYIANSNSYILFNEAFHVHRDYAGEEEVVGQGFFAVKNSKTTGQLVHEENNIRYLKKQGSKLYSVKVDIESFYPNVYTHYLSKIKSYEPHNKLQCDDYFDFLDYYNMKTNNNQTKGIAVGVFSSAISAELLMLCVDYEIENAIGDEVEYIRYVDDMLFFSDSLEKVYSILPLVQVVLNKYRLRINNNKTEAYKNIYNKSYVDMYELKKRFSFFDFEEKKKFPFFSPESKKETVMDKDVFYNIKGYIAMAYDNEQKSEIKAFLTLLKTAINKKKIYFSEEQIQFKRYMVSYLLQLSCMEPVFSSRCYRIIIEILEQSKAEKIFEELLEELRTKNYYINTTYHDSIMQIWHYYVLSQYENESKVKELILSIEGGEINPIILAAFVKTGRGKNEEIFKYIKSKYSAVENKEGEENIWKRSIMFSKWWFPLLMIYLKDEKDYSSFYSSNNFHSFYKEMRDYFTEWNSENNECCFETQDEGEAIWFENDYGNEEEFPFV